MSLFSICTCIHIWHYVYVLLVLIIIVGEYIKQMNGKINPLLVEKKELTDEELEKLGKRVEETYPKSS